MVITYLLDWYLFFYKETFIGNLHVEDKKIKELELLKTKFLKKFSILNIFIIANN